LSGIGDGVPVEREGASGGLETTRPLGEIDPTAYHDPEWTLGQRAPASAARSWRYQGALEDVGERAIRRVGGFLPEGWQLALRASGPKHGKDPEKPTD
jgi:hypothetical protein